MHDIDIRTVDKETESNVPLAPGAPLEIYEVEFKGERRGFFTNPQQIPVSVGDAVIVEADRGEDLGRVIQKGELVRRKRVTQTYKILRKATAEEIIRMKEKTEKEAEAFRLCRSKIEEHGLPMKLVDVECQFDGNKISFFFTADRRVDFRELVKDLASTYRTRIDLRQIGVRDEAKRLGGYGPCGRRLCCSVFMNEFEPVSSQMAKEQHLALSPNKISGVCGRLMCCLLFEQEFYQEAAERFPRVGTRINMDGQHCEVCRLDIFHDCVYLKDKEGVERCLSLEEVNRLRRSLRQFLRRGRRGNGRHSRKHTKKKGKDA